MKKLLLIGLAVSGLVLVPWQRADAQVTIGFPEWDSVLDFREAITLIRHATIIILTGTIGDRTTLIPSHIRITVATDTPRTTGVELTTAIIAIVITTAIELIVGDGIARERRRSE